VDQGHVADAINWLFANQQADGSWKPHYGETKADLNFYIAAVLSRALTGDVLPKSAKNDLRERVIDMDVNSPPPNRRWLRVTAGSRIDRLSNAASKQRGSKPHGNLPYQLTLAGI
jgi:hypothetical protein